MNNREYGAACFERGMNCAQAVLLKNAAALGLDETTALKLATGFGGGLRAAEVCGAVSGAVMVIGLRSGMIRPDDKEGKDQAYQLVREFMAAFQAKYGTIRCKELLNCDISSPEGMKKAREAQLFGQLCPDFIADALRILHEIGAA